MIFATTEWRDFDTGDVIAAELYDHKIDPRETKSVIELPADATAFREAVNLLVKEFPREGYTK